MRRSSGVIERRGRCILVDTLAGGGSDPNERDEVTMSLHIPTPHVAEVSILFQDSAADSKCENTLYVEDPTDAIFSDYVGFAAQVQGAANTHLLPVLTDDVLLSGVIIEDQRSIPYAGLVFPQTPAAGAVATGSTAMPNQNALAVKKSTGVPGRSGRGRWFWPVWASVSLSNQNTVAAASANAWTAALAAMQAAIEGGTYPCQVGIVSKQTGGAARASGVFYQITSWSVSDLTIDSQRRRLPGRGA
jgi:hypothetical protein